MDKRQAHHWAKRVDGPLLWYVFAIFLVLTVCSAAALRSNYQHMTELRAKVYAADKADGDVVGALQNLRQYVGQHMNTSLSSGQNGVYPPIQLKYTYDRLIKAKSTQTQDQNAAIYTQAQKYCEAKIPTGFSGRYRISCIQDYVKRHNASPTYINPDMYKFDFYSPAWSPDLAGWSLVLTVLSLLVFAVLLAVRLIVRRRSV